ncbi:alpha/beta hydrolase [Cognatiyoonia sp.]|uniref:alpha/beta hydrolase n=1 Tax=Cognatiyoonia sp. TaxID=2211652 RepID=UPI003F699B44
MVELVGISAWLAQREATVPALRPGCEKRIQWAAKEDRQTQWSVVFIHGFSASPGELSPMPQMIALNLRANLFLTRLTGHGQDGAAFGASTYEAWQKDANEAFEIGAAIGERVIVMACSTGCTLASLALASGLKAAGVVYVSPNFGLHNKVAQFTLDLPFIRYCGHLLAGREQSFEVENDLHAQYWTTRYPTSAVYPMGEAVRRARRIDYGALKMPAFFALNDKDQVINASKAKKVMAAWGGSVTHLPLVQGPEDDKMGHVMAGDAFSPNQTETLAELILDWAHCI